MIKAFFFDKTKFDYSALKDKTTEELFDLWNDNPTSSAFYDNIRDVEEDYNSGALSDMFVIFIDGDDTL